jgi:pimeloyl-ACP methyl ester carboxylesterase
MTSPASYRAGHGEPLVLVHGFTDTWRGWTPVLPLLQAHHDLLAVTLPGHLGGEPWDSTVPVSIRATADRLEAQLQALGIEQAHMAGSSLGGWLCLEMAARGRALSVVGVCPAGGWEPASREERSVLRFFRRNQWLVHRFDRRLPAIARHPRLRRLALRDVIAKPRQVSAEDALALFQGALGCSIAGEVLRLARSSETFGELGPIDCPVRVLYGSRDRLLRWPGHYTRMRRLLPDAEWVCLEGLGHLPMWDDPDRVAAAILEVTGRTAQPKFSG